MPAPNKRTRASNDGDENSHQHNHQPHQRTESPSHDEGNPHTPVTRRAAAAASTTPGAPLRPAATRSSTSNTLTGRGSVSVVLPPPPARSNSLFGPATRRANSSASIGSSSSFTTPSIPAAMTVGLVGVGVGGPSRASGPGTLMRTQSTPVPIKSVGGGSGPPSVKGDDESDGASIGGGRRWGKGKENIPPKDEPKEEAGQGSRKRLRIGSRTPSVRGRSGSVASVRSETTSSRPSVGPSSSLPDLHSRRPSFSFPSPSPSLSSTATPSLDSLSSSDPFEYEDNDVTPTKPRVTRRTAAAAAAAAQTTSLPTPPPSSPSSSYPLDDAVSFATSGIEHITVDPTTPTTTETFARGSSSRASSRSKSKPTRSRSRSRDDSPAVGSPTPQPGYSRAPLNAYRHLKSFLRLSSSIASTTPTLSTPSPMSSVDATIIGRDDEKAVISSYLSLVSTQDVGMYISGPPGTGKTALATAVGRELASQGWRVIELGVMGLKVVDIWRRLGSELGCQPTEADVSAHLAQPGTKTYIILDEVDSLLPPPPSLPPPATSHALSKLFSFPLLSNASTTVKLIAISNTLDLTVRANLVLPEGTMPQVLAFRAYGATEMTAIVNARVAAGTASASSALNSPVQEDASACAVKVDTKAVELLSKKVEAQNGDLRMCLGVLGSAVTLAEAEWTKKTAAAAATSETDIATITTSPTTSIPLVKVALPHILKAFTSHTNQLRAAAGSGSASTSTSPVGRKILSVPVQGKMVLVSILVFLARTRAGLAPSPASGSGSSTPTKSTTSASVALSSSLSASEHQMTTTSLYAVYAALLGHTTSPFPPAPESDYRDLLSNLEDLGLVVLSKGRSGAAKVELRIRMDELQNGLNLGSSATTGSAGTAGAAKGVAEQEVAKIWAREEAKIKRVKEKAQHAMMAAENGMGDEF